MDAEILRILDVNLNRAREALRVIEDYTRFVLDDADAAGALKHFRHTLREVTEAAGVDALLAARDIVGDVGRDVKTAGELRRESIEQVVRAAFGRLSEAARGLDEYGKVLLPSTAKAVEDLRYAAYELEQRIVLRGNRRLRFRGVRLYVLITERLCRRDWFQTVKAAIDGGAGCIQLREKELDDAELLRRARRLRELTTEHNILLAINNRPDIAKLSGADIVHVGQTDLSVREVRHIAGANILVGKSTHTIEQLRAALAEKPDYVAVGPMFPSATKPREQIAGPQMLTEAAKLTQLPLVAIGGIAAENAGTIINVGVTCLCVCAAVSGADNPEAAARELMCHADMAKGGTA